MAVAFLQRRACLFCARIARQVDRLHTAGCLAVDSLVAKTSHLRSHVSRNRPVPLFCSRQRAAGDLEGEISSRHQCAAVARPGRSNLDRESGTLVLPEQNTLAFEAHFYLSTVEN